jgi:rod shape determining protein RodA
MNTPRLTSISRFVNPALVAVVIALAVYGSIMVRSAVSGMGAGDAMFRRHLVGLLIGLVPLVVAWAIDYRKLQGWVGPLLLLDAFLIVAPKLPGLGATAKGAQSWLQIGDIRLFQPSEPAKLITIVVMAAIISQYRGSIEHPKDLMKVLGVLAVPLGLILLQPDLGTGLVFIAITAGMLLVGGLKGRWFAILGLIAVVAIAGGLRLDATLDKSAGHDVFLKDYQMNRLLVFVDPTLDSAGAGYNLDQSKIAIGSGELSGKGLGSGTQGNLNFLPERHTDFIFSVLGEELGFIGAVVLLGLYLFLLFTALEVSASSRDLFGALIAAGVISMWTFQILENVGMTIGLMPITGIPLPFMSFGSSFMVTNMAATGMLLSVWTRRYS